MEVSAGEWGQLAEVLKGVPGPTHWFTPEFPNFEGPSGVTLRWAKTGSPTWGSALLPEGQNTPRYLGLGFYCYVARATNDQLLLWRHVGEQRKPRRWDLVRMSVFDTGELGPIDWLPDVEPGDPVCYTTGLVANVDLPATWQRGRYSFEFPEAFKATPEVIMLVSVYHNLGGLEQALYIVHPQENAIDVVLLDWWNEGDFDFGYQWITKVGRGPGGRLFGTGFRINPFVVKETGEFIEWIQPPSDSLGSQRIPS